MLIHYAFDAGMQGVASFHLLLRRRRLTHHSIRNTFNIIGAAIFAVFHERRFGQDEAEISIAQSSSKCVEPLRHHCGHRFRHI